jgi:hypothetical protein
VPMSTSVFPKSISTPSTVVASSVAPSITSANSVMSSSNPFKDQLITLLQIPVHLTDRTEGDLRSAYQKYLGYLQAVATLESLIANGAWPGQMKKPSGTDIVECFISKSMYFTYYRPAFTKLSRYPEMVKWLENKDDVPSALEAWGLEKPTYSFKDLMNFVGNDGVLEEEVKDTGKRKVKEKPVLKKVVQSNKKRRTS